MEAAARSGCALPAIGLSVLALCGSTVTLTALIGGEELSLGQLVAFPSLILGAMLFMIIVLRRWVLKTHFNRQLTAAVVVVVAIMVLGRTLGFLTEVPVAEHFARDSFMMGAAFSVLGITHLRWIGGLGVWLVATGVGCTLWPEHAMTFFGLTTAGSMLVAAAFSWRAPERK